MRPSRFICSALSLIALAGLGFIGVGCNEHVRLGVLANDADASHDDGRAASLSVLWSSKFETMDLSEWDGDLAGGYFLANTKGLPVVVGDLSHTGLYSSRLSVASVPPMSSISYLFRNTPSPSEAYYSAWYYVPSGFQVTQWLSLVHFNGNASGSPIWDLNAYPVIGGGLRPHLYNYRTQTNSELLVTDGIPRDTWVHIEVLFVKATTPTGRIAIWIDDKLALDLTNIVTVVTDYLQWNVGMAVDAVAPSPSSLYIDDAAISVSRLGSQPLP